MAYVPAYNASFAKPLLNQLIAIIQRDQAAAIALVNPALAPINEFHKGPGLRTAFPWLALAVSDITFDPEADTLRHSEAIVELALDVGQFDQEMAQDNAADYARMMDMVITSASGEDWETSLPIVHETVPGGVTAPNMPGTVKRVFVNSHHLGLATRAEIQTPLIRVSLSVAFELNED